MTPNIERSTVNGLYPPLQPFHCGRLKVDAIHEIYFEESGNPKGKPVVFLHGGPGGGSDANQRRYFNPSIYRIVTFDQRGCGKSTPHACLENNTTWHLVSDIEALRQHLSIETWQVFGGSWGSTLALAYAQTHPTRVTELVLRGIFLLRQKELSWLYQFGASEVFPDYWEDYIAPIPEAERGDLMTAFHKRLTSDNAEVRLKAAVAWSAWEGRTSRLITDDSFLEKFSKDDFALAFARIEAHYFVNGGFLENENQLIDQIDTIRHIPTIIVQGRYDMVCPMISAWDLHRAWPQASLVVIPDAGHSAMENGIARALVAATDQFAK